MIVYRPAFFFAGSTNLLNLTDIYSEKPWLKSDRDSSIILKNSTFKNLNAFSLTRSLALTGMSQITDTIENSDISYPTFVNKGIVLNLEEFGGRIEIVSCTFEKNFHYIPFINYTGSSYAGTSVEMFTDTYGTKELHF